MYLELFNSNEGECDGDVLVYGPHEGYDDCRFDASVD